MIIVFLFGGNFMNNILLTIIILVVISLLSILYFKFYKGDKINKILIFLVGLTIIGAVMFLVCFPRKKWNDEDYFMGIAQMVGGLFTVIGVYFTIKEEEKMRKIDDKNADNKIKEQLRLENLPVLKFSCDNEEKSCDGVVYHVDCETSDDNYKVQLNIKIKNVGLGSAQNIWFQKIIGIENDDSKSGIENQIIEPKETINYTMYFEFPKNDTEFYKRLTILVFYDDLLENKYMQKLDGSLSISCCESDGICQYNPNAFVLVNEKYVKIGTDFKYEIPQEIIEDEISRIEYEEKQKQKWNAQVKQSREDWQRLQAGENIFNNVKCPTCGSTNTKKISGLSKAASVGLFGIFSQKVKHQFHCNNCGYEW